jgi:hypothetical protein
LNKVNQNKKDEDLFMRLTLWMISDAEWEIKYGCLEGARRCISVAKHYLSCAKKYGEKKNEILK